MSYATHKLLMTLPLALTQRSVLLNVFMPSRAREGSIQLIRRCSVTPPGRRSPGVESVIVQIKYATPLGQV